MNKEARQAIDDIFEIARQFGFDLHYILDRNRNPVSSSFAERMDFQRRNRWYWQVVGRSWARGYIVSTVFLGTNHNWLHEGPPILFETMIFREDWKSTEWQWRSRTWNEAVAVHEKVVRLIELGVPFEWFYIRE